MNLKRIIREELNKTLLNEDTPCADSVEMDCGTWDCTAALHSTNPCKYHSCCNGISKRPKGQTMAESRGYRSHRTRR